MQMLMIFVFLALAGAANGAEPAPKALVFYRQIFASPEDIVSAAFTAPTMAAAARPAVPSSRLSKYFNVSEKVVKKNKLYLELRLREGAFSAIVPEKAKLKVWIEGAQSSPEGPWRIEAEGPLGQKMQAVARLDKNSEGSLAVITVENSTAGETVSKAIASAVLRSGLLFSSAKEARELSVK